MSEGRPPRSAGSIRRMADATSIGLAFPIAMAIGFFVGRWLDRVLSTAPWLMVVFTVFGIAGGFLNAIRTALRIGREEDEAAKNGKRGA